MIINSVADIVTYLVNYRPYLAARSLEPAAAYNFDIAAEALRSAVHPACGSEVLVLCALGLAIGLLLGNRG